jgi:repressor LexA
MELTVRVLFVTLLAMKQTLTKKQKFLLDFIKKFSTSEGYPPSFREIMEGLNYSSVATVAQHIDNLVIKGYLHKKDNEARSIQLVETDLDISNTTELPLLGFIAAGQPISVMDDPHETLTVPPFMIKSDDSYVLQVKGQSMIDDGILDGDYVIIRETHAPQNGDVVVAMVNGYSATLKRFYKEGDKIRLQPANSSMRPLIVKESEIEVQGIVTGVIRKY